MDAVLQTEWAGVLDAAANELRKARRELEMRKRAVEAQQALLEQTQEWLDLVEMKLGKKAAEESEREAYMAFANAAQTCTAETGVKKPHKYVTVGERHEWQYDEEAALVWCLTKAPDCIEMTLDKKKFEALLESGAFKELAEHAERVSYLKAAIAKDLEK